MPAVGAAVVTVVGGVIAAKSASNANKRALNANKDATTQALDYEKQKNADRQARYDKAMVDYRRRESAYYKHFYGFDPNEGSAAAGGAAGGAAGVLPPGSNTTTVPKWTGRTSPGAGNAGVVPPVSNTTVVPKPGPGIDDNSLASIMGGPRADTTLPTWSPKALRAITAGMDGPGQQDDSLADIGGFNDRRRYGVGVQPQGRY